MRCWRFRLREREWGGRAVPLGWTWCRRGHAIGPPRLWEPWLTDPPGSVAAPTPALPRRRRRGLQPSRAESSRVEPSRVEPSRAEPSRAESSRAKRSQAEPSEPSQTKPSQAKPSQASQAKPSEPSQASQAKRAKPSEPSQASQAKPSQAMRSTCGVGRFEVRETDLAAGIGPLPCEAGEGWGGGECGAVKPRSRANSDATHGRTCCSAVSCRYGQSQALTKPNVTRISVGPGIPASSIEQSDQLTITITFQATPTQSQSTSSPRQCRRSRSPVVRWQLPDQGRSATARTAATCRSGCRPAPRSPW
jgi:hypothetical protein